MKRSCQVIAFLVIVSSISAIVMIVGMITFAKSKKTSQEINRQKLFKFLERVKSMYFDSYKSQVIYNPGFTNKDIVELYSPYDPMPSVIKSRTDIARQLRKELTDLQLDLTKLKPREIKANAQLKHYLDSTFGNPHGENYYAGDWMMGPNYYCIGMMCRIGSDLEDTFYEKGGFQPLTISHVEKIKEILMKHKSVMEQYTANMMYGVRAGMVRAVEDCQSGRSAFQMHFPKISEKGEIGMLDLFILLSSWL